MRENHVRFGLASGQIQLLHIGWCYYEFKDVYKELGEEEHIIDIIKLFTDTFLRSSFLDENGEMIAFCFQVGDGDEDHTYWGPPELYPKNLIATRPARFATAELPGSDVCAGTAAALATSYLNFKDTEPEYAEKCLKYAKAMYKFAREQRTGRQCGYYGMAYG